jgi:hypothetical protein
MFGGELRWTPKFGSLWGAWCSLEPVGAFGVGLWMNIRKG